MATSYWQKLKDPRWQRRRLEILNNAEFACEFCFDKESTLHVHHLKYDKGKDPWEYGDEWLACLCESCHEEMHAAKELMLQAVSSLTAMDMEKVAGYAFGLAGMSVMETGAKGPASMRIDPGGAEAIGIYDAIRYFLPQPISDHEDLSEVQISRLINDKGEVTKGAIWQVMCDWMQRRRAERDAKNPNNQA